MGGRSRHGYAGNDGLFPSGYRLFRSVTQGYRSAVPESKPEESGHLKRFEAGQLWKGWVLPASDADVWFVAGAAAYYRDLRSDDPELEIAAQRTEYRRMSISATPLEEHWRETNKGVVFLDGLRRKMSDDAFLKLMRDYFAANTTKTVTAQSFLDQAKVALRPTPVTAPSIRPAISKAVCDRRCWSTGRCARRAPIAMPPNKCKSTSWTCTKARCRSARILR